MHRLSRLGALLVLLAPAFAGAQTLRPDGPPVRLVADDAPALAPAWSPDGALIAFTRPGYVGLWTATADGGDVRQVTDAAAAGFGFSWAPDGGALLARPTRYDGPRRENAVVVYALDGEARALTDWRARMPALPRWAGPAAVALPGGDGVEVLAVGGAARAEASGTVAWAADGALAVAEPAGGSVRRLDLFDGAALLNVTLAPDGERVAFEVMGGNLFTARLDGTDLVDLGPGHRPTWSPDGRWVAFMTTEDDGETFTAADLWAARADGSARVALTQTPDRLEMNPSWSPDGGRIAFDEGGALYVLPVAE